MDTQTKVTHTPGPWTVSMARNSHGGCSIGARGRNDYAVATAYLTHWPDSPDNDTDRANARLIAAAPDLLAACKATLAAWDSDDMDALMDARKAAKAAIAKAEGN